jgi:hypothetical protein
VRADPFIDSTLTCGKHVGSAIYSVLMLAREYCSVVLHMRCDVSGGILNVCMEMLVGYRKASIRARGVRLRAIGYVHICRVLCRTDSSSQNMCMGMVA